MSNARTSIEDEGVVIHEGFDASKEELWQMISDPDQLAAWMGGTCTLQPQVGGEITFDLPDDGMVATGTIRQWKPPDPARALAGFEHTFIDRAHPDALYVCGWWLIPTEGGCDLRFSLEAVDDSSGAPTAVPAPWGRLGAALTSPAAARRTTPIDEAVELLRSAKQIVLIDWVTKEIPRCPRRGRVLGRRQERARARQLRAGVAAGRRGRVRAGRPAHARRSGPPRLDDRVRRVPGVRPNDRREHVLVPQREDEAAGAGRRERLLGAGLEERSPASGRGARRPVLRRRPLHRRHRPSALGGVRRLVEQHRDLGCAVHTDDELTDLLGSTVVRRDVLHSWPLSLVEELETAAGDRWIYKAQRLLPVEPAFYRAAASRTTLLPAARVLTDDGVSSTMLLEHLGSPVSVEGLGEPEIVALAHEVVDAVATLPEGLPHHLDWGSRASWHAVVDWVLDGLRTLGADGRFARVANADVEFLSAWASSPAVHAAVDGPTRLTCNDIKFDQVFRRTDGHLAVVDWAIPVIAPGDLDLVGLLESAGIDPLRHVDREVCCLSWFRLVHWAVLAKLSLIPEVPDLFDVWAALGIGKIRAAADGPSR